MIGKKQREDHCVTFRRVTRIHREGHEVDANRRKAMEIDELLERFGNDTGLGRLALDGAGACTFLVDEMKKVGTNGKDIFISHCQNLKCAQALKDAIEEAFRGVKVTLMETRFGNFARNFFRSSKGW